MHTALKIGIGAVAVLAVGRMLRLGKLAANVTVSLSRIRVHKVNLAGIEIAVTAKVNNPSDVSVQISSPVVRLWDNKGGIIAESIANGKDYPIAANRQSEVGEILLPVSWGALLPLMGIKNITSIISLFGKDGTKGLFKAFSNPISMTVLMRVGGMTIETPKTVINK